MSELISLENGLKFLMLKSNATGCVNTNIFYAVGGGDEIIGKSGIAHFLEHLSFKSTLDFAAGEFDKTLKSLGANNNACTSNDYTHYYATSAKEHSGRILRFYASMMDRLAFKEDEFNAEKLVILEEERLSVENSPFGKLWFCLHNEVYKNSALESSVIGYASDIKKLSMDDVMSFYRQYYAPNNALVILSGDVNESMLDEAMEIFSAKKSSKLASRSKKIISKQEVINKVLPYDDLGNDIFALAFRIPSFEHEDFRSFSALAKLLNLEHSSPIIQRFVKEKALCSDLESYAHATRHEGLFIIFGTCNEGVDAKEVIAELKEFLKQSYDSRIVNDFIALENAEIKAMPKELASEIGTAWAMGDINVAFKNLSFICKDNEFERLNKYFTNEISIIFKEKV